MFVCLETFGGEGPAISTRNKRAYNEQVSRRESLFDFARVQGSTFGMAGIGDELMNRMILQPRV